MIRLATVFSGIGAIEHALKRLRIKHKIVFACDNGDVDILSKKVKINNISEFLLKLENLKQEIKKLEKDSLIIDTKEEIINNYKDLELKIKNLSIDEIEEKNKQKLIKSYSETLSMIFEKLNTFNIQKELEKLTFKEKKKYVDNLYQKESNRNKVKQSYFANYDIDEENFHWNVSFLDGRQYTGKVDLFVGGSPCQSFSLVGKQRGLQDTRGTLFYEYARLVKEIRPKVFIYENVKAILSNDNGKTLELCYFKFKRLWNTSK